MPGNTPSNPEPSISALLTDTPSASFAVRLLLGATIFLSAFLLFFVQPLLGKALLPLFGGAPAVWSVCLVFFQSALVAGYLIAHLAGTVFAQRPGRLFYSFLLIATCATLHILPGNVSINTESAVESQLITILLTGVFLPYITLAAVGPLLQSSFARWFTVQGLLRFYALSNLGSFLALFAYPLWLERVLPLSAQAGLWQKMFLLDALFLIVLLWLAPSRVSSKSADQSAAAGWSNVIRWLLLSALGTLTLIVVTNELTVQIAPMPLIWIVPLAAYLLTFVFAFDRPGSFDLRFVAALVPILMVGVTEKAIGGVDAPFFIALPYYTTLLFVAVLMCQLMLVRLRPTRGSLTTFYLCISIGGAIGGLFSGLIAPHLFADSYEYPFCLVALLLVAFSVLWRTARTAGRYRRQWMLACVAAFVLSQLSLWKVFRYNDPEVIAQNRNFFGVLTVKDRQGAGGPYRLLNHGAILHGLQLRPPLSEIEPVAYFSTNGGVGKSLADQASGSRRIAVIGLGVGAISALLSPGDAIDYFEINPLIREFAEEYFSFLRLPAITTRVLVGDGRKLVEQQPEEFYDLVVIDAFTGDSVPAHLMTEEAVTLYLSRVRGAKRVLFHISNRHLNLLPPLAGCAKRLGLNVYSIWNVDDLKWYERKSHYLLLSSGDEQIPGAEVVRGDASKCWTDEKNSVVDAIEINFQR